MVDPISIISLVEGSIGLILQCGSAIKSLNEIAAKYKQAELTLSAMIQEVDVIELAWRRIKDWFECYTNGAGDVELLERLDKSLKCGTNVISALQDDLLDYGSRRLGFMQRSRLSWNEEALRDHQYRIRGQVQAMSLLLQVIELPTSTARSKQLQTAQRTFLNSDESAYSIVPSRMSISSSARNSVLSVESAELIHHRWDFESDLLGARVYKRNYIRNLTNSIRNLKGWKAKDEAFTMLVNDAASDITDDELEASANDVLGTITEGEIEASINSALGTIADDKREASANGALRAPDDVAPVTDAPQGLVLLDEDTSGDSECHGEYSQLDIVAIPGTAGPTQKRDFFLELRDSLPMKFPSARIFTFNYYSSDLLLRDGITGINSYAEKLLSDLKTAGAGRNNRQIVFIAYDDGLILTNRALFQAKDDWRYSHIDKNALLFQYIWCHATWRTTVKGASPQARRSWWVWGL